ncbi:glyoxalase, partial [Mycobacterium sp. ITM-2017-0098]
LGFQKVPDPTPGKNKVHLDFHGADKEAEVARLVGLGARETGRRAPPNRSPHRSCADPEGNAFCVAGG